MSAHAKIFQPSKAACWVPCTGMLALTKDLPEGESTIHNTSGTLTHSIAEFMLKRVQRDGICDATDEYPIGSRHEIDGFWHTVDDERIERAETYARAILARGGMQFYEVRLDLTPVVGVADQFGTADAVIVNCADHSIEVHDLKDGRNTVDAEGNWQLIIYALAALAEYAMYDEFLSVSVHIHQPKVDHYSEHTYTIEEMREFAATALKSAGRGMELMHPKANPKHIMAALNPGPWCEKGWCKARGTCPARSKQVISSIPDIGVPTHVITVEQMGDLLHKRKAIEDWFSALHAAALATARSGTTVPGWKLANGRAGNRKWSEADEEAIGELLYDAIEHETFERTLISPATAEKKLKKLHIETWNKLQSKITRSEAQTTLVPEADSRPAIQIDAPEFGIVDSCSDLI